jgi:GTP cyclohydrolase FolE2
MTVPRHQRSRPSFSQTFERGHEETIAAMDRGGHDIPNQSPSTPLRLKRVGVKRHSIPVRVADPFGSGSPVVLSCSVEAFLSLAPERRGIHVSRIGDLLARLSEHVYPSLQDYAVKASALLRSGQDSDSARVAVEGVLTYLENVSGVKKKASLEHLEIFAECDFHHGRTSVSHGVGFSHITACPCVQETYRNSFAKGQPSLLKGRSGKGMPLLTHTQRCQTRIQIANVSEPVTLSALLSCIDGVVVRSQNTLPREFELLNVYRAHARPQFLEDALRDLLVGVYRLLPKPSAEGALLIQTVSMESIHDFDMEGEIEFSVKELDRIFAAHKDAPFLAMPRMGLIPRAVNGSAATANGAGGRIQKAGRKKPGKPSPMKRSPQAHSSRS